MNSKIIYLSVLVLVCLIQSSLSQKYSNEPTIQEVNSKELEQKINNVINSLIPDVDKEKVNAEEKEKTNSKVISTTVSVSSKSVAKSSSVNAPRTTTVVRTTTVSKPTPTQASAEANSGTSRKPSNQNNSLPDNNKSPSSGTSSNNRNNSSSNNKSNNGYGNSSNSNSNTSSNTNSNRNNSSSSSNSPSSNSSSSSQVTSNNGITQSVIGGNTNNGQSVPVSNAAATAPVSYAAAPVTPPATDNSAANPNVIPDASTIANNNNENNNVGTSFQNIDGGKSEEGNKKSISSIVIKVSIGLAVGGICVAGLIVGKNKFGKKEDDIYKNVFNSENLPASVSANNSLGRKLEGVDTTPNYNYQPINNYSQSSLPKPIPPQNNDFIDTNSIEPLPNLVNKVDVELPVFKIEEENYNTVGRPLIENNTWNNDEEITDKTKLLNNNNNNNLSEGYSNIVPEIGHMVIEHTNCPSFTSSMFDAMDELNELKDKDDNNNDNMKQIIPDIQYATVEVNNEFDNIIIDEEEDEPNNNMKQIIPDIQYATVEVNNEFAGIDEDEDDDFRSTRTNPRIVVDINARDSVMTSADSDVEELRVSKDFLAMPDSLANFKQISDTYHNALRDTFYGGNRDTLSSTDSILHKLH